MRRDRDLHTETSSNGLDPPGSVCPECGAENTPEVVICAECRTALVASGKSTGRSGRRRSKVDSTRRAAPETKRFGRRRAARGRAGEAILWEGKLSMAQRLRRWMPDSTIDTAKRVSKKLDAKVILAVGVGAAMVAVITVALSARPSPGRDTAEGLGMTFEVTDHWQDVRDSSEWPGYFVVASKILSSGAQPSLVFVKGNTGLAVLSREVATDTTPPEAAFSDAETLGLVYSLSSDTRLQGRGEASIFGSRGVGFTAERWAAGSYYNEEAIVVPLGNRVVYVVYTAPQTAWEAERREIRKILESARPA